jgi:hypothetical protein
MKTVTNEIVMLHSPFNFVGCLWKGTSSKETKWLLCNENPPSYTSSFSELIFATEEENMVGTPTHIQPESL